MMRTLLWLAALPLILTTCSGCKDQNNLVPNVPVNITININQPDFFNLTVVSGWVYVTGGSRGIIVYRKSVDEFVAIERHSSYQPADQCAVAVNADGVILQDPCSASQWLIMDGSLVNGPASAPLRTYQTSFTNPVLYIYN
ncbi:MAG: hypothetical protein ACKOZY_00360 [Flavobacteriales bacterium]